MRCRFLWRHTSVCRGASSRKKFAEAERCSSNGNLLTQTMNKNRSVNVWLSKSYSIVRIFETRLDCMADLCVSSMFLSAFSQSILFFVELHILVRKFTNISSDPSRPDLLYWFKTSRSLTNPPNANIPKADWSLFLLNRFQEFGDNKQTFGHGRA